MDARFTKDAPYPQWMANFVPVLKKDGRLRMCLYFRDLNKASPEDDCPLPHIDVLVNNTGGYLHHPPRDLLLYCDFIWVKEHPGYLPKDNYHLAT